MPEVFDTLIIGGGIVGIGILRDLSLHKVKTLLVERGDFCSQTSMRTSKMLHGGIRYLENFEFSLVREALHEKNLWLKLAPHLAQELPFHMPIYKESKFPLPMVGMGMFLYDFLSDFENSPFSLLSAQETLKKIPYIRAQGLTGAGVYHDAIMEDGKLGLECLYDALHGPTAHALNYHQVVEIDRCTWPHKVVLKNNLDQTHHHVWAKEIVMACGPFTDQVLGDLKIPTPGRMIVPSKGIHLWVKPEALPIQVPLVLQIQDGRVIFIIPERGHVLIGTNEKILPAGADFFDLKADQDEIQYLLKNVNEFLGQKKLGESDIIETFAGVRPLVLPPGKFLEGTSSIVSSSALSREHHVVHLSSHIQAIVGGKYTTFRVMAQDVARNIMAKLALGYDPAKTLRPLRQRSLFSPNLTAPFKRSQMEASGFQVGPELKALFEGQELAKTTEDIKLRRVGFPYSTLL